MNETKAKWTRRWIVIVSLLVLANAPLLLVGPQFYLGIGWHLTHSSTVTWNEMQAELPWAWYPHRNSETQLMLRHTFDKNAPMVWLEPTMHPFEAGEYSQDAYIAVGEKLGRNVSIIAGLVAWEYDRIESGEDEDVMLSWQLPEIQYDLMYASPPGTPNRLNEVLNLLQFPRPDRSLRTSTDKAGTEQL